MSKHEKEKAPIVVKITPDMANWMHPQTQEQKKIMHARTEAARQRYHKQKRQEEAKNQKKESPENKFYSFDQNKLASSSQLIGVKSPFVGKVVKDASKKQLAFLSQQISYSSLIQTEKLLVHKLNETLDVINNCEEKHDKGISIFNLNEELYDKRRIGLVNLIEDGKGTHLNNINELDYKELTALLKTIETASKFGDVALITQKHELRDNRDTELNVHHVDK